MAFVEPKYSKKQVNKAGDIIAQPEGYLPADHEWATWVLANWRACHLCLIDDFHVMLRARLQHERYDEAIVGRRLKRTPSIKAKLQRFADMKLSRSKTLFAAAHHTAPQPRPSFVLVMDELGYLTDLHDAANVLFQSSTSAISRQCPMVFTTNH